MSSKGPKPLDDEQQRQLRSAFYDLRAQVKQAQTTCDEISRILKGEATRPRGAVRVVDDNREYRLLNVADTGDHEDLVTYDGPIEVGMHFIWMKDLPRAWAHVVVTKIDTQDSNGVTFDERRIWTRTLSNSIANRVNGEAWNEEGRCREAFTPCDERGNVTS